MRLFELLKISDFFDIDELQKLLGTHYKFHNDFRRFTIERAVCWLNKTLGYNITYKFIAVGNVNRFIKFFLPKGFGAFVEHDGTLSLDPVELYKILGIDV